MKRLLILVACAALLTSGCRSCSWWRRGAPCRSLAGGRCSTPAPAFDPYASVAPATCGVDGFSQLGDINCGNDITVGTAGMIDGSCPTCGPGYYGGAGTVIEGAPIGIGGDPGTIIDGASVRPALPAPPAGP